MSRRAAYLSMIKSLLPVGQAWTREPSSRLGALLDILAGAFDRVDTRSADLIEECDPRSTFDLLAEWEKTAGLPDLCTGVADTLQERRRVLAQKITSIGNQSKAYFQQIAEDLGYDVEIREYRPFICGINQCGDELAGPPSIRNFWNVKVLGPRITYFRTGLSRCGERLLDIDQAEDLECIFRRLKPAHTQLIFAYAGV